ncbi:hypothetical protein GCM10023078_45680 [Gibbsiella greigii]
MIGQISVTNPTTGWLTKNNKYALVFFIMTVRTERVIAARFEMPVNRIASDHDQN